MSEEHEGCCCGHDGEHKCGCGHDGEHKCGCDHDGEHKCGCDHDGEHKCGCGHDGEHKCGCGHDGENKEFDFEAAADYPMPKPNLIIFATTIAQQAMVSMGILPNPITKKSVFMLNQATYLIDTLDLIFEKTNGNRTEEETKTLENMIHELRMLFVAASNEKKRRDEEKK